jgi:uncharacterized membrane protein (UPF0136 family)
MIVVITGCAVLAAVVAPVVRNFKFDDWFDNSRQIAGAAFATLLGGALLGKIIGLHQFHRQSGVLFGAVIGAMIAPAAALLMTVDRQSVAPVVQAVLIGCAILIATAWFIRPPLPVDDKEEVIEAVEADAGRKL